ncbi:MAG: precorrin-8X methylmutase [Victivallales bacterium]|nr:precorrin-8X methylmutase [Victivallales bacterium]
MFEHIIWNLTGPEIERESFRRIAAEYHGRHFSAAEWPVARRLIHTTADFAIADTLQFRHDPIAAGLAALRRGAPIYTDANMIKAGLSLPKLQHFYPGYTRDSIHCGVADPATTELARREHTTRALAALQLARPLLHGSIFLCGNAPLALAGMVKMAIEEGIRPALIVGMPVGFVNVVEAKELLRETDLPHITIEGRRGGSPLAVATLHAIMEQELP